MKSSLYLTILIAFAVNAASGQTSGSASLGKFGSVSYTLTERILECSPTSGPIPITDSYEDWQYASFVFHDASGATHSLSGTATYIQKIGTNASCPPTSGVTVQLAGTGYTVFFTPGANGTGSASLQPQLGNIDPKYVVLAVVYAPPGSKSSVDYGQTTMMGSSTSISNSFTNEESLSISLSGSVGILGTNSTVTGTSSTAFTQEGDSSSSIDISKTDTNDTIVNGPSSDAAGVDHDYDTIFIWLNPVVALGFVPGPFITEGSYGYDMTDPCQCMDVLPLQVAQLKNPALITDTFTRGYLARTWAPNLVDGSAPGLTNADLLEIANADPFVANPNYSLTLQTQPDGSLCSTDQRFCSAATENIPYVPPAPGGQPSQNKGSLEYTKTTTDGTGGTDTRQVGFSLDVSAKGGFLVSLSADLKTSTTLTWTHKYSSLNTQKVGQNASWSVTGPAASANYTGPTLFDVYQDNVYGTFMFYPQQ